MDCCDQTLTKYSLKDKQVYLKALLEENNRVTASKNLKIRGIKSSYTSILKLTLNVKYSSHDRKIVGYILLKSAESSHLW